MTSRPRKPVVLPHDFVLRVSLREIVPEVWRRVRVPDGYSLDDLHVVLQFVFGWANYHLYDFRVADRRFEAPDPEAEDEDATAVSLRDLMLEPGDRFEYVYDFGDDWIHEIVVEERVPGTEDRGEALPTLLGGERAAPPEDCGGPGGFADLRAALADPSNPEHAELLAWVDPMFEPERFDPWLSNQNLMLAMAMRRNG